MFRPRHLILFGILPLAPHVLLAASGTEGASFLDIPVGAGPAALGSAYTALATDAYAPIYNPAGLGLIRGPELSGQHLSYLESINYEFGSVVIPVSQAHHAGLGVSIQYLGSGNITGTNPDGSSAGDFSAHFAAYTLSYGQKLMDKLSLGVSGKVIDAKIADVGAHAYAADVGALYELANNLHIAATITNMGDKLTFTDQGDTLPIAFHLAAAYQPEKHLKVALEGIENHSGGADGRFGVELDPVEMISLRVGYKTDTTKQLSALAGLTTGIGINAFGQEFAYAWLPYGDLGDTHYFSLLLRFGKSEEERRNLIQYQNIKTHQTVRTLAPTEPEYMQLLQLLQGQKERTAEVSGGQP